MGYEFTKKQDPQEHINFGEAEFTIERDQIAKDHNIINLEILTKVDGKWFASGLPVEEYDSLHNEADLPSNHQHNPH